MSKHVQVNQEVLHLAIKQAIRCANDVADKSNIQATVQDDIIANINMSNFTQKDLDKIIRLIEEEVEVYDVSEIEHSLDPSNVRFNKWLQFITFLGSFS